MNDSPPPEPGHAVRVACLWITGLVVLATVVHLLTLPPSSGETEGAGVEVAAPSEEPDSIGWRGDLPITRVAADVASPLDPQRAMGYLRAVCDLGPRISGSRAMGAQQRMLVEHFEGLGAKAEVEVEVELQRFAAPHPRQKSKRVKMANVIVRWRPAAPNRVLLCGHYDTRPLPDQDSDPRARQIEGGCLGANDGGSSVAVLMELGHLMAERFETEATDPDFGVDFALFDAEELVYSDRDPYFLGSQWFGRQYKARRPRPDPAGGPPIKWSYDAAVLLDMVGDADLQIHWEGHSFGSRQSRPICREVWEVAQRLGVKEFVQQVKHTVMDDHLALRKYGGIRAIDVIDFDYPHWHTTQDTPDKCSGESLATVGWVMWEWLLERGNAKSSGS